MTTVLDRRMHLRIPPALSYNLTSSQIQMDEFQKSFVSEASNYKSLFAMTAGAFAYRFGKMGVLSLNVSQKVPLFSKLAAPLAGLGAEVAAFRGTNYLFNSLGSSEVLFSKDFLRDCLNFGGLKLFGKISKGQPYILSHFFQDTGMVLGNHLSYALNLSDKVQGNLAEQYLHASITNFQMSAGFSLFHQISQGKIQVAEKNLEVLLDAHLPLSPKPLVTFDTSSLNFLHANRPRSGKGTRGPDLPPPVRTSELQRAVLDTRAVVVVGDAGVGATTEVRTVGGVGDNPEAIAAPILNASDALQVGMSIGPNNRYILKTRLGSGGFGDVYQVYDTHLSRMAVIKVPQAAKQSEDLLRRFDREIKIGANLDPRYSVAVYDRFELSEGLYVPVMEFVPGNDLSRVFSQLRSLSLSAENFDFERRLTVFSEICEAMEAAHRRGIMHRDLKPDNIRIDEEGHVRIMDWGIAKTFSDNPDSISEGDSGSRHIQLSAQGLTQQGTWAGTIGYVAPEVMQAKELNNPRSPDIFALGVILYEWISGVHPFGQFENGNPEAGKAKKVPVLKDGMPALGLIASILGPDTAPSFDEVMLGNTPAYIKEIEPIARKAFSVNPQVRYQSIQELREAVLLAFAHSEQTQIHEIQTQMRDLEHKMHEAWDRFDISQRMEAEQWEAMHQPISKLREMRANWRQKAFDLIKYIETTFKGRAPEEAKKMIAELAWKLLIDEGDVISLRERQSLEKLIKQYDVATANDARPSMKEALEGTATIQLNVVDQITRETGIPQMTRVKLIKYFPEKDSEGDPVLNYRPQTLFDQSLKSFLEQNEAAIRLNAGYYVFEVTHTGYHTTRIPVHITLEDIRRFIQNGKAFNVTAELVLEKRVPHSMVIVQGGKAYTGIDIYKDPNPLEKHSPPLRQVKFKSFAITRNLITVSQYQAFIESILSNINRALRQENHVLAARLLVATRHYIPRAQLHLDEGNDLLENPNPEKLSHAFERVKYNWKVETYYKEGILQFRLQDPCSHLSASNEPIFADQPIHAIPLKAIRTFIDWKNRSENRTAETGLYRLPEREELEIIARNTFLWPYPWGYLFNPNFLESRLTHAEVDRGAFARGVATHSRGMAFYRDISALGIYDLLGNTRKITGTSAEAGCVYCFGGSVRTPFGPYFLPSALLYAGENTVNEYNSSFYLAISLPIIDNP